MQREIENRAKKDEQDILWEELEEQFESIRKAYKKGLVNLNQVVIEKSALYLKVENYIDNVKDKTEIKDTEAERKLQNRRMRKYKNNKVADLDAIRLTTSVDEFLMKNTDIENQSARKKHRNIAIEIDEEIKMPDDLTESNMSNHFMINFEKIDNKPIKTKRTKETEDDEIFSPVKFNSLKPEGYKEKVFEDNNSDNESIPKVNMSKFRHRKYTEVGSNLLSMNSLPRQFRRSSFSKKSVDAPFVIPDHESEPSVEANSKELEDYCKEIHKITMKNKKKGIGRKVKIGVTHDQPIKRKRNKKTENINSNQTINYQDKLEQSIDLESMFDAGTFGNDYSTIQQNQTENDINQIHGSNNMLFVKSSSAKGKKANSRYEHRLSSEINKDNEDQNLDIQVQDFDEQENDDYGYSRNKMETIDKSKRINYCNYLDQVDDVPKVNSVHIRSKS